MRMIFGMVCHGDNDKCWSDGVIKYSYDGVCDEIWNDFCVNYYGCNFDICKDVNVIMICYVCICAGDDV